MAHEDDASVVLNEVVDGGQGSLDTGGVANDAILIGTLKSTRTRTRLPSTSMSRTVFLVKAMFASTFRTCLPPITADDFL